MYLDSTDKGISQNLITHRIHEELPTQTFVRELRAISAEVDNVTVFDIGTNIGYYLLIEARTLGDRGEIYAIEPHPRNRDIALKNIELNGYNVNISEGAIGATTGTSELYVSDSSNKHSVNNTPVGNTCVDVIEVSEYQVDDFIESNGGCPSDINVIRMDIEGYETQVFDGMKKTLNTETPLIMFIELHTGGLLSNEQLAMSIDFFREQSFEIVDAIYDPPGRPGKRLELSQLDDLYDLTHDVHLFLKRP